MKNKLFRVLSAMMLALTVMATVSVGPTFAAQSRSGGCTHGADSTTYGYKYVEANSEYHWCVYYAETRCNYCYEVIDSYDVEIVAYETHNLDGYSAGKWVCTDCGYEETPGTR